MTHRNRGKHKHEPVRLALTDAHSTDCLGEEWSLEPLPPESLALTFWDSFEWGIWFGGHLLYSRDKVYRLSCRADGWLGKVVCEEKTAGKPRFQRDFKDVGMREKLEGMLGLRGLMPVARGTLLRQALVLRDGKRRIVCRLECVTVASGPRGEHELCHHCLVVPLPGFASHAARVAERLVSCGAVASDAGPLEILLRESGREPRPYTLRPAFGLRFDMPAREALTRIVVPILEIAEGNVTGILEDVDTEFLHDYRVCLRKVRSVLSLVKGVYPAEETAAARKVLGDLARRTNALRDIDVYLLAREQYLMALPPVLQPALERIFADFEAERVRELRRTRAHLKAGSKRLLFRQVKDFFAAKTPHGPAPTAELPVGPLVSRRIYKTYRKIRRLAAQIQADTPDEQVHELRIACKKLRYLLEFFGELVPEKQLTPLLKSLRRLQDRLGEFNDASVQQKNLMAYWRRKQGGSDTAMALGGLISVLHERQRRTRSYILDALEAFCGDASSAAFKHLFKRPRSEAEGAPQA